VRRAVVCLLVAGLVGVAVRAAVANPAWEKRLREKLETVEDAVAELDGAEADRSAKLDVRILALDARVAAQEKEREIEVVHVTLANKEGMIDLGTRSAAIVQIEGRVRRIKKHDEPPEETPSEEPTPEPEANEKEAPPPEGDEEVEWPDELQIAATASVDYTEVGTWLYGAPRETREIVYEYLFTGYEGQLHLAVRLRGLVEQVRSVEFRVFVTGRTGPFRFEKPLAYDIEWKASHRHMWNGAKKNWNAYDQWNQVLPGRWITGPRHKYLRPRVEAWLTRVVTDKGRVIELQLPAKRRER